MKIRLTTACLFGAITIAIISFITPLVNAQETKPSEREARRSRYMDAASKVKGGSITPHWMSDGSFWYADGTPDNTVVYKVDPEANIKTLLFDTARPGKALAAPLGHEPREVRRPNPLYEAGQILEGLSPDKRWFATLRDHNLWLRSPDNDSSVQLTSDGRKHYEWGFDFAWTEQEWAWWSPDSSRIAVKRVDYRNVDRLPIVDWLKTPESVEELSSDYSGGAFPRTELFIIDIRTKQRVRVKTPLTGEHYVFVLGWRPGGSELLFFRIDREYKTWELMAADRTTGTLRKVFAETGETFVGQPVWVTRPGFQLLKSGNRFLWLSERDGWAHIYLYDIHGTLIRRLTEGAFPVGRIVTVDEADGWVYFTAHGDPQRPYDTHLYRVTLEGKEFTRLTEAPGQHSLVFAPSNKFYLDTHSAVDRPPVVELRKADGTLLQVLSNANIDSLTALNWRAPEEFKVKAADGVTDLYGVLYKPLDYDPGRKYPVIDFIYGGPNSTAVGRTFGSGHSMQGRAELGFIVFAVDARGTPERGKRFLDVVFRNMGRHEIPDHVAALKQLAAERPYMDRSRVGITGGSAGGYFTVRALLLAPDVYHVGVARASLVDPKLAAAMGAEPYMGLPEDNRVGYEYASNLNLAHNLQGKLLLIHGTQDKNTALGPLMKLVDSFVRANKHFDLLLLPADGHGFVGQGAVYAGQATMRYFQEHLKP